MESLVATAIMTEDPIHSHVRSLRDSVFRFRQKFANHPSACEFGVLDETLASVDALSQLAPQLDYKDVRANGVRSLIRACERCCRVGLTIRDSEVDDSLVLLHHLNIGARLLLEGATDMVNGESLQDSSATS